MTHKATAELIANIAHRRIEIIKKARNEYNKKVADDIGEYSAEFADINYALILPIITETQFAVRNIKDSIDISRKSGAKVSAEDESTLLLDLLGQAILGMMIPLGLRPPFAFKNPADFRKQAGEMATKAIQTHLTTEIRAEGTVKRIRGTL